MSPLIEVSEKTYELLEELAQPFVDKNPEDVIVRLIEEKKAATESAPGTSGERVYSGTAPNLSHTKLLSATIDGRRMISPNWNNLMNQAIHKAANKLNDPQAVSKLLVVNHIVGHKSDNGYTDLSAAGISVQGQDSNNAWKAASHIYKALGISAEVVFTWNDNPKAANPGQVGKFVIGTPSTVTSIFGNTKRRPAVD